MRALLKEPGSDLDARKEVGKTNATLLIALALSSINRLNDSWDRAEQIQRNLHVAFALGAYKADNGRYPAKLDDLAPKYLAAIPGDVFSGKPLIYKPTDTGFLVYSVGVNGKDDGGQTYGDDPPGDDIRVRLPLPLLKKNN